METTIMPMHRFYMSCRSCGTWGLPQLLPKRDHHPRILHGGPACVPACHGNSAPSRGVTCQGHHQSEARCHENALGGLPRGAQGLATREGSLAGLPRLTTPGDPPTLPRICIHTGERCTPRQDDEPRPSIRLGRQVFSR